MRRPQPPRFLASVLAAGLVASCSSSGSESGSPALPDVELPENAAAPALPAMERAAADWYAEFDERLAREERRIKGLNRQLGESTVACGSIDPSKLTAPVDLPAPAGELFDEETAFLLEPGTVVRAPVSGEFFPYAFFGWGGSTFLDHHEIRAGDFSVAMGGVRDGLEFLVDTSGLDFDESARVTRGQPLFRVNDRTASGPPGMVLGLDAFNLVLDVEPGSGVFSVGPDAPTLTLDDEQWEGGVPTSCGDWPSDIPEGTPPPERSFGGLAPTFPDIPGPSAASTTGTLAGRVLAVRDINDGQESVIDMFAMPSGERTTVPLDGISAEGFRGPLVLGSSRLLIGGWRGEDDNDLFVVDLGKGAVEALADAFPVAREAYLDYSNLENVGQTPVSLDGSPDGTRLLVGRERSVTVVELESGSATTLAEVPEWPVPPTATFSPDGAEVAFGRGGEVRVVPASGGEARSLGQVPAERLLPTGRVPSGAVGERLADEVVFLASIDALAFSPDGSRIAATVSSGSRDRSLLCVFSASGGEPDCPETEAEPTSGLGWASESTVVFADDVGIMRYDVESKKLVNLLRGFTTGRFLGEAGIGSHAISPDGNHIAFVGSTEHVLGEVYIADVRSGEVIARLSYDFDPTYAPLWLPAASG